MEQVPTGALAGALRVVRLSRSRVAGRRDPCIVPGTCGVYLNLVEGLLWVQDVVRSNRTTPTNHRDKQRTCSPGAASGFERRGSKPSTRR
jgi:hypothetical protein